MAGRNGVAGKGVQSGNHRRYVPTSHEGISHDSLANLGQDWSLVADPGMEPRPPFKVYLPRTTEDVVTAVRECRDAGEQLRFGRQFTLHRRFTLRVALEVGRRQELTHRGNP